MQIPEYENYHETKSHSTPDFPYNAYICSIPLDFEKVPLHWHDEVEIIYIKKGRGRVTLDFTSLYVEEGKKSPLNCKAVAFWKTAADTVNMI